MLLLDLTDRQNVLHDIINKRFYFNTMIEVGGIGHIWSDISNITGHHSVYLPFVVSEKEKQCFYFIAKFIIVNRKQNIITVII